MSTLSLVLRIKYAALGWIDAQQTIGKQTEVLVQRRSFNFSNQFLPQLEYSRQVHLMNLLSPASNGGKMSSPEAALSRVKSLDAPETPKNIF